MKTPFEYWDVNVLGTINLVKVMLKYEYFLWFLVAVQQYMEIQRKSIKEDSEINPTTTYGLTKSIIEKFLFDIHKRYSNKLDSCS